MTFFVCRGGAISYRRVNRSAPDTSACVLFLLALLLVLWAGSKLIAPRLAARAFERIGVEPLDVAMVVGDTGHRANRVFELMGFASINLPQLDGIGEVRCMGTAMGACGTVPFVTALALARHHALKREAPVLFVSNEDPYRRMVAVVQPHPVDNSLDKRRVNGGQASKMRGKRLGQIVEKWSRKTWID